jgi:hypothetical protein
VQEAPVPHRPAADTSGSGRLAATQEWLSRRADTRIGRLVLLWFRRYFEASRNSGAAASAYITIAVLPAALVMVAFFDRARGGDNAFADRLITHMHLEGATANLVSDLFGTTHDNLLAASVTS